MAAAIGEPSTDPHGAPIPSRDGTLEEREVVPLASLGEGEGARVERVSDDDADRLRYLAELSIVPGANVQLMAREPYGGPIVLMVGDSQRSIGPELAAQILVSPTLKRPRR